MMCPLEDNQRAIPPVKQQKKVDISNSVLSFANYGKGAKAPVLIETNQVPEPPAISNDYEWPGHYG